LDLEVEISDLKAGGSDLKSEISNSRFEISAPPPPQELDLGDDDSLPAVGKVWDDGPKRSLSQIMADAKRSTPPPPAAVPARLVDANVEPVDGANVSGVWKAMLGLLAKHGQSLQGLLSQGRFVGIEEGRAVIRYSKAQETTVRLMERNGKRELVSEALSAVLNQPTGVRFEIDADDASAPVAASAPSASATRSASTARPAAAPVPEPAGTPAIRLTPELRAELECDPLIRAVIEMGASIVKVE
jgi:hypothetical protein